MYGYIYKTTNLINGKLYIGKHAGTFLHDYIGSGVLITKAIQKYGKKNFRLEVLAWATTEAMLNGLEQKYIYEYRQVFGKHFLYNICWGGKGGHPHTEETKKKISQTEKGIPKKPFTEEHKKKLGLIHKGTFLTKEHKQKISEGLLANGDKLSQCHKGQKACNKGLKGKQVAWNKDIKGYKIHSEEHKLKMSLSRKGISLSEAHKQAIKASWIIRRQKQGVKL